METLSALSPTKRAKTLIDSIPFSSVIHALKDLGGVQIEHSSGHNAERYELPNGRVVGFANSSRRLNAMHTWSARKFLGEVVDAGIDENLFLALANTQGVSWTKHDPWVEHLTKMLREHRGSFHLDEKAERERFLRLALEHYAPAVAAAAQVAQAEPEPNPEPLSHSLKEAIELALDTDNAHMKRTYYVRIRNSLYRERGSLFELVKDELVPVPGMRLQNLTSEGALLIGSHIEEEEFLRRGPPPVQSIPAGVMQGPDNATEPESYTPDPEETPALGYLTEPDVEEPMTEARDITPTIVPEADRRIRKHSVFATGRPTTTPERDPGHAEGSGPQTLLDACNHLGIQPAWSGYALDVEGTLWNIARSVANPS